MNGYFGLSDLKREIRAKKLVLAGIFLFKPEYPLNPYTFMMKLILNDGEIQHTIWFFFGGFEIAI